MCERDLIKIKVYYCLIKVCLDGSGFVIRRIAIATAHSPCMRAINERLVTTLVCVCEAFLAKSLLVVVVVVGGCAGAAEIYLCCRCKAPTTIYIVAEQCEWPRYRDRAIIHALWWA